MHRGRALSRKGLGRGAGGKQMAGEAGLHDHQGSRVFRSQRPGAGAGIRARLWPWPRPHREKFAEGNGRAPVRTPEEMLDQSAIAMQQTRPSSVRLETTGVCPYPWCRGSAGSSAALGWPGGCGRTRSCFSAPRTVWLGSGCPRAGTMAVLWGRCLSVFV